MNGHDRRRTWWCGAPALGLAVVAGVVMTVSTAAGAQETRPADEPKSPPSKAPTLDELLGLDEETGGETDAETVADRAAEEELQRRLDEEALENAFAEALETMSIIVDQLETKLDTGLATQRAQEEVLAKLDHLLNEARKQQQSGGGSSSSSSQSQPQPQPRPEPGKPQPGQGQPGQNQGDSQPGDNTPDAVDRDPNSVFEENRTEWGTLPERVRDMLLQGRQEKFSSLYEQLTREYYRRLAEEGSS